MTQSLSELIGSACNLLLNNNVLLILSRPSDVRVSYLRFFCNFRLLLSLFRSEWDEKTITFIGNEVSKLKVILFYNCEFQSKDIFSSWLIFSEINLNCPTSCWIYFYKTLIARTVILTSEVQVTSDHPSIYWHRWRLLKSAVVLKTTNITQSR